MLMFKNFEIRNFLMIPKFQKVKRKRKPQKYHKYLCNRILQIRRQIRVLSEHKRINLQKNDVLLTLWSTM